MGVAPCDPHSWGQSLGDIQMNGSCGAPPYGFLGVDGGTGFSSHMAPGNLSFQFRIPNSPNSCLCYGSLMV